MSNPRKLCVSLSALCCLTLLVGGVISLVPSSTSYDDPSPSSGWKTRERGWTISLQRVGKPAKSDAGEARRPVEDYQDDAVPGPLPARSPLLFLLALTACLYASSEEC